METPFHINPVSSAAGVEGGGDGAGEVAEGRRRGRELARRPGAQALGAGKSTTKRRSADRRPWAEEYVGFGRTRGTGVQIDDRWKYARRPAQWGNKDF